MKAVQTCRKCGQEFRNMEGSCFVWCLDCRLEQSDHAVHTGERDSFDYTRTYEGRRLCEGFAMMAGRSL